MSKKQLSKKELNKVVPFLVKAGINQNSFGLYTDRETIVGVLEIWKAKDKAGARLMDPEGSEVVDQVEASLQQLMRDAEVLEKSLDDMLARHGMRLNGRV